MAPLRMMPASHSGYELTTVSKILDGHTRKYALDTDKPRQGVVASSPKLSRKGAVGFI
jgi:hypothetical protein